MRVLGKNKKHRVLLYTLSACGWCSLTKDFLKENNIEYEYIDVDLCSGEDREKISEDILAKFGSLSYPAIIIDDDIFINGFQKDMIRGVLGI